MKQVQEMSSWLVRIKPPGKASRLGKRIRRKMSFIDDLHRTHNHFTTLLYWPHFTVDDTEAHRGQVACTLGTKQFQGMPASSI